jgi:hypothetical protein
VNKTEQAVIVISWNAHTKTSKFHLSHQIQVMNVSVGFLMSHIESFNAPHDNVSYRASHNHKQFKILEPYFFDLLLYILLSWKILQNIIH